MGWPLSPEAGFELARTVKSLVPDVPVVLQPAVLNSDRERMLRDTPFCASVRDAASRLARILTEQLGFGDFVFRMPDQTEVGRASDLNTLEDSCSASRRRASPSMTAQPLLPLAYGAEPVCAGCQLRPRKVSDFPTIEHLRQNLIESSMSTGESRVTY